MGDQHNDATAAVQVAATDTSPTSILNADTSGNSKHQIQHFQEVCSLNSQSAASTAKHGMVISFSATKKNANPTAQQQQEEETRASATATGAETIATSEAAAAAAADEDQDIMDVESTANFTNASDVDPSDVSSLGFTSSIGNTVGSSQNIHANSRQQDYNHNGYPTNQDEMIQQHLAQSAMMSAYLRRSYEATAAAAGYQRHPPRYGWSPSYARRYSGSKNNNEQSNPSTTSGRIAASAAAVVAASPTSASSSSGGSHVGEPQRNNNSREGGPISQTSSRGSTSQKRRDMSNSKSSSSGGSRRHHRLSYRQEGQQEQISTTSSSSSPLPPISLSANVNENNNESSSKSPTTTVVEEKSKINKEEVNYDNDEDGSGGGLEEQEHHSSSSTRCDNDIDLVQYYSSSSSVSNAPSTRNNNNVCDRLLVAPTPPTTSTLSVHSNSSSAGHPHFESSTIEVIEKDTTASIPNSKNPERREEDYNDYGGNSNNDENDDSSDVSSTQDASQQEEDCYQHEGGQDSKYETYACLVDPHQEDRAVEIHLYSFSRPHMRAFHFSWMSFFVAFFTWFAITPLLSEVAQSLELDRSEIWTSSTFAVAGSAVTRILIGPLCDQYGARWAMSGTLLLCSVPTALTGLVYSASGLNILRLVIGVAGSAFVTCQYWTSSMFTVEVAGAANAIVAGWGNLGGGVTQIVMGSILFPLFKIMFGGSYGRSNAGFQDDDENGQDGNDIDDDQDRASDLAWRTVCIIPAIMCFLMSIVLIKYSDDAPKGNHDKRHRQGHMMTISTRNALKRGIMDFNTWVLFLQYGCCFGVEITMVNAAALYFREEFGQSIESAAAIASVFGWMNLFARGVGGFASDISSASYGMRGRLSVQTIFLVLEGISVILFSKTQTLAGAIGVMVVFSIFVQGAEGATYGIVPYVNHSLTGTIAGIIGAGGNFGGVAFSLVFRQNANRRAFAWIGYCVIIGSLCTIFLRIKGHSSLLWGADAPEVLERRMKHMNQMGNIPTVHTGGNGAVVGASGDEAGDMLDSSARLRDSKLRMSSGRGQDGQELRDSQPVGIGVDSSDPDNAV